MSKKKARYLDDLIFSFSPEKREITPHKGGRTETQLATMTPETKAAVSEIKEKHGLSLGDLVEWAVQNYRHEI